MVSQPILGPKTKQISNQCSLQLIIIHICDYDLCAAKTILYFENNVFHTIPQDGQE